MDTIVNVAGYSFENIFDDTDVSIEDILSKLEELYMENIQLQEHVSDLENSINEDFTPKQIDPYDEYGMSPEDFY